MLNNRTDHLKKVKKKQNPDVSLSLKLAFWKACKKEALPESDAEQLTCH